MKGVCTLKLMATSYFNTFTAIQYLIYICTINSCWLFHKNSLRLLQMLHSLILGVGTNIKGICDNDNIEF
jgi:hypothetical protein